MDTRQIADALEAEYLAVANGMMKPGKIDIEAMVRAVQELRRVTARVALSGKQVDAIMEQAQVFASAWSLVGGVFDSGNALETAEQEKANLRALLAAQLSTETVDKPVQSTDDSARDELRNIANAKRLDRERFADDTEFADWVQSRARHILAEIERIGQAGGA